jgi:hypothetical protein
LHNWCQSRCACHQRCPPSRKIFDRILRYTERGEGNADFWANGQWHANADLGFVTNTDGSGCQSTCKALEIEPGKKEWWFRIRSANGQTGWTNASDSFDLKY